jgi:hypothetical protein
MHGPSPEQEAKLDYRDGAFRVIVPGTFVTCHVTGQRIYLEALRYWSVERQVAFADAAAAAKALRSEK